MMKKLSSVLLVASILMIGVFSFAFLNHQMDHTDNGCLVNTINGEACPSEMVEFAMDNILISSIFSLFFTLIIFLLLFPSSTFWLSQNWRNLKFQTNYRQRSFIRWLALLEHSPSS